MIKKAILVAFIAYLMHLTIVLCFSDSGGYIGQKDKNIITIERFLYSSNKYKYVCVGSSMTEKILSDSIPDFYNLGLLSCCAMDGLHFVNRLPHNKLPDYVYVEINTSISNEYNNDILDYFKSDFQNLARGYVVNLRDEFRPFTMFKYNVLRLLHNNSNTEIQTKIDTLALKRSISYLKEEGWIKWGKRLDYVECMDGFRMLKYEIDQLQSKGVNIVFFFVPMNREIENGPKFVSLKKIIKQFFPEDKYRYMPEDTTSYLTSDGIHLDGESAISYTQFFKNHILVE